MRDVVLSKIKSKEGFVLDLFAELSELQFSCGWRLGWPCLRVGWPLMHVWYGK